MREKGFKALGMEPVAVGVSSDADHIITPSIDGPTAAIENAFAEAGIQPEDLATWDLHATATPGDYREVETLRGVVPESVVVTARKGTFGHGMSAGGGWELTAQYLGFERGRLYPDAAPPRRAQPGDREDPRPLRLRRALRGRQGGGRQAVDGDRRHQRLRDLAAVVRALITPALFSRPLPPSRTGRRGRKEAYGFSRPTLPWSPLSPGAGGWEGTGERGLGE